MVTQHARGGAAFGVVHDYSSVFGKTIATDRRALLRAKIEI
jgi:hypothetical protein